jgi:hypothetical protein
LFLKGCEWIFNIGEPRELPIDLKELPGGVFKI